jgi:hypothetical protein
MLRYPACGAFDEYRVARH